MEINLYKAEISLKTMHIYFADKSLQGEAQVVVPNSIVLNSATHYCYLFYNCLLDYGTRSKVLHENMCRFYEQCPELFSPAYITETYFNAYTELADILRTYTHVRFPNECAKRWIDLSVTLHVQYQDNPQKMFKGKTTYNELKETIIKINGFGQKTGGLLLRMLIDNDMLIPCDGIMEIPIDRHDVDLSIWLGVICGVTADEVKKRKKIIKLLSDTWVQVANTLTISPSLADRYLWIIGSKYCASKNCLSCPLRYLCNRKELEVNEKDIHCSPDV